MTVVNVTPDSATSSDIDNEGDSHSYQKSPLTSTETFLIVSFLALFSLIYLIYAQHHKILFYVMTSLIALWIMLVYTAGIFSVLYMIIVDYDYKAQDENNKDNEAQQESSI
ncbi:hypothetical protein KIN20_035132 [Parelaphostrongylus tenuis]|uniref:Uncharacterized protein n=1 Tax=Parelaphostrongylus tenuis TaxID=148309 RepID=A0AAD5WKJ9_PARTN|nr:hypothetical protein KIN20_035132 [Parelaphostrongylus tenuis]